MKANKDSVKPMKTVPVNYDNPWKQIRESQLKNGVVSNSVPMSSRPIC